jgi:hypothetical protein
MEAPVKVLAPTPGFIIMQWGMGRLEENRKVSEREGNYRIMQPKTLRWRAELRSGSGPPEKKIQMDTAATGTAYTPTLRRDKDHQSPF